MILPILAAAAVAVIAAIIVIRSNKPDIEYFEGIQAVYKPGYGYRYRFYMHGREHSDGFYPTGNAAIMAAWEHHKQLTPTGNPT